MTDRIDLGLRQVAADVIFPATPALADAVRQRLEAGAKGRSTARPSLLRPLALAVGLTLVVVAAVAALTWVLPGLRIVPVASVPPASVPLGDDLGLGAAIDPDDAPFRIDGVAPIAEAYALRDGSVTSLVYAAGGEFPEIDGSGIGLLIQRIAGDLETAMVEKLVDEVGARVVPVSVGDAVGFWIEGPPHLVRYLTPSGGTRAEMTRLVGDTLVWQGVGVLYRMESSLGIDAALRLAASVRER